eukprot:TRINITY_DN5021_c0_g1_i2.p1 TRINITY_DN5021_c0_g1~~TRINITY_DN5021_c0_g1_i2.p1  ORF type:complete len:117 (-),score=28.37 TRINITY_DN5021_c0_g1_i2:18-368(-)
MTPLEESIVRIRILKDPKTFKPRGCAFLEVADAPTMQKALNYHNTELLGRQVRVQLTAGGGGKGENRKKKLFERNEKLREERVKKHQAAMAEKGEVKGEVKEEEEEENVTIKAKIA